MGFEIKLHIVDAENGTYVGRNDGIENTALRAAQKRLHARDQMDRGYRLDHKIIGACEEAPQALAFLVHERDDRPKSARKAQPCEVTAHISEFKINYDDVRGGAAQVECCLRVIINDINLVARAFKVMPQPIGLFHSVIENENSRCGAPPTRASSAGPCRTAVERLSQAHVGRLVRSHQAFCRFCMFQFRDSLTGSAAM